LRALLILIEVSNMCHQLDCTLLLLT